MSDDQTTQEKLDALRAKYTEAKAVLYHAVVMACPDDHQPVQHRDHKPPWCPWCGRDNKGRIRGRARGESPSGD